ncbi:hypothetical protein B0H14DRAFT_3692184 [Mycena olivaceomarginata]|nr:hypothetical protein B0H14DRAFT_3692184 [Mycena olivaceomarginata]
MDARRSHKRKAKLPTLVTGATSTQEWFRSQDDRRMRSRVGVVGNTVPAGAMSSADWYQEDLVTSLAREDPDFTYQLGNTALACEPDQAVEDGIEVVLQKFPRYPNADQPLKACCAGKAAALLKSTGAAQAYVGRIRIPSARITGVMGYRNIVVRMRHAQGRSCIVARASLLHTSSIQHISSSTSYSTTVQRWTGTHFVRKRTALKDLGLRIQLNHPPGVVCPFGQPGPGDFVLYDLSGVHEIVVDFCGCRTNDGSEEGRPPLEHRTQLLCACWWPATIHSPNTCATFSVLRLFQLLNCMGKLSAYDFLRGLEMCTNHDSLDKPPIQDRRKPFMHIMRQWREVKRMKRFKRGHLAGGARATAQGELALQCRACPQPGWNLPENWESIDPFYRFIYCVFLAVDANFRLSNRNVSTELADPILGDGFGFFCRREGEDGYKSHIAKHASEQEISNCSGFQAMFMANTKQVKGLRTTGIDGVTCSRHNMWQGNGMGDLQVGERMPEEWWLKLRREYVIWKVPNFHLPPHKPWCHGPFSFHFMLGAGMTTGEGVEQNWAFSNGAAGSTRLMGPGARHATLEDVFGFHNYDRTLAMRRILPKRLAVGIKEGLRHQAVFDAFSRGLEESRPALVAEWKQKVLAWEAIPNPKSEDSPFELLQIATDELIHTEDDTDNVEIEREHSPGSFITMGLELEVAQWKLEVDVRALKDPSVVQRLAFTKRRTALRNRITKFRQLQRVYMPALRVLLSEEQKEAYDGNGEQLPEATRLFMPSELSNKRARAKACAAGLAEIEARVRHGLWMRTMTNHYKLQNYTGEGQAMMTRGQGLLHHINIAIHIAKLQYRYARAALLVLRGHGDWELELWVLEDDDVRALNERALTAEEKAQNKRWAELGGAMIEGGIDRAAALAAGEGSHTLSWIWYSIHTSADDQDPRLDDALRLEWCKAYARMRRLSEEVHLLCEEMRRTIAYGQTAAKKWDELASEEQTEMEPDIAEGRRAYAFEHAATEHRTCETLDRNWAGILAKADAYLEGRMGEDRESVVTVEMEMGDELDPEEEEARLEGEEEE